MSPIISPEKREVTDNVSAKKIIEDIPAFEKTVWLASPTMHGEELKYMQEAYDKNWMSTIGENIDEAEKTVAKLLGVKYGIGLNSGTSAIHLALKLAGVKPGVKVACTDMTFAATVNPVSYEGGEQVLIDSEYDTWNMDPKALEKAFKLYPDIKVVIVADLYGTPAKLDELKNITESHGAIFIEDAAESLGATYKGKASGSFGYYNAISFNGNKIITGSSGGMLLSDDDDALSKAKFWSTQAREDVPWYQHEEIGYNYRMSNVIAGVVRGQLPHLYEHIQQKKDIYYRYKEGLKDLPVSMNPFMEDIMEPNYWLSCILIDKEAMCPQERTETTAIYYKEKSGTSCPTELYEQLMSRNVQCRPIWKPMHMQPVYKNRKFVSVREKAVDEDIFDRGLCLPSDNKMTVEEQERIIEIIKRCFE